MTDLQRLIDWHAGAVGQAYSDLDDPLAGNDARAVSRDTIEVCQETARILSVLLRVREGCELSVTVSVIGDIDGYRGKTGELTLSGPADTLRDLTELLGGGK